MYLGGLESASQTKKIDDRLLGLKKRKQTLFFKKLLHVLKKKCKSILERYFWLGKHE